MRVYLDFLGCRLNEAELSTWRRQLISQGHQMIESPHEANVIAVNTCAVTSEAARKSRKHLRQLHRTNPKALLVATGCYATLSKSSVEDLLGVDLVIPNAEKDLLPKKIEALANEKSMPNFATVPGSQPIQASTRTRAFVKIQDGCRNKCSFCIVTVARGKEKSRTVEDIVQEVQHLCDLGYQEAVLTGVHIGGYGKDIASNLRYLIEQILKKTDLPRLRIGSLEPWDIPKGFFGLFQNKRLCPHLHLPLQSGSNSVLKRMFRRCHLDSYSELIAAARAAHPQMNITTDLIVGFPGETANEFQETLDTLERFKFGDMHIFRYSARDGTAAARMPNHVAKAEIKIRHKAVHTIAIEHRRSYLEKMKGLKLPVLWERDAISLDNNMIRWHGYTHNYLRVECITKDEIRLFNRCTQTRIQDISSKSLIGEPIL